RPRPQLLEPQLLERREPHSLVVGHSPLLRFQLREDQPRRAQQHQVRKPLVAPPRVARVIHEPAERGRAALHVPQQVLFRHVARDDVEPVHAHAPPPGSGALAAKASRICAAVSRAVSTRLNSQHRIAAGSASSASRKSRIPPRSIHPACAIATPTPASVSPTAGASRWSVRPISTPASTANGADSGPVMSIAGTPWSRACSL